MNIGYLRYFLLIYFICFIQKNDHSKLKKKQLQITELFLSVGYSKFLFLKSFIILRLR